MNLFRVLLALSFLFWGSAPLIQTVNAAEAPAEREQVSPQRQKTGAGVSAGAAAGQSFGRKKGFFSQEVILGGIALAAVAAVAIEVSSSGNRATEGGGAGTGTSTTPSTTTSTTTSSGTSGN